MDWIDLAQDKNRWQALVNAVMNLQVPQHAETCLTSSKPVSLARILLLGVSYLLQCTPTSV